MKILTHATYSAQSRPLNRKECSFGIHYDNELGKDFLMNIGDGIRYKNVFIKNYTELLRGVKAFQELPKTLIEQFPDGAPIFDYACSTGHEACSIIVSLFSGLSPEKTKRFLPIKAFDNNAKIVHLAQAKSLQISPYEVSCLKQFKNINIDEYLSPTNNIKDGQNVFLVNKKISENVEFNYGDLFEDLANNKLSDEPCVLFFRNAWQFLTKKGAKELADMLFEKLKPKSVIIIGDKDIELQGTNLLLKKHGFTQLKEDTPLVLNGKDPSQLFLDVLSGDGLSKYCFVKP